MKTTCLIVQNSEKCVQVLKYIDKNIVRINNAGILINIESLPDNCDEDMVNICNKYGINRLPAIIDHNGIITIGHTNIITCFEKLLKNTRLNKSFNNHKSTCDVDNFWENEMFEGYDKNGKRIFRTDVDVSDNDHIAKSIEDRIAAAGMPNKQSKPNNPSVTTTAPVQKKEHTESYNEPVNNNTPYKLHTPIIDTTIGIDNYDTADMDMLKVWLENNE